MSSVDGFSKLVLALSDEKKNYSQLKEKIGWSGFFLSKMLKEGVHYGFLKREETDGREVYYTLNLEKEPVLRYFVRLFKQLEKCKKPLAPEELKDLVENAFGVVPLYAFVINLKALDVEKERSKIEKELPEIEKSQSELKRILSEIEATPGFRAGAPDPFKDINEDRRQEIREKLFPRVRMLKEKIHELQEKQVKLSTLAPKGYADFSSKLYGKMLAHLMNTLIDNCVKGKNEDLLKEQLALQTNALLEKVNEASTAPLRS